MNRLSSKILLIASCNAALLSSPQAHAVTLEWIRQFGNFSIEYPVGGVLADALGNVYTTGSTSGCCLGGPHAGEHDVFIVKFDASGIQQWARQIGTAVSDDGLGVAADSLGNVYFAGATAGSLGGPFAGGTYDAFLAKYDASGNELWLRQLGTDSWDNFDGVSLDGMGNIYLSGQTRGDIGGPNIGDFDVLLSKYDAAGNLLWTRQFGTASSESDDGISADGLGNVYVAGHTSGAMEGTNVGGADGFVAKYDSLGNRLWTRQIGTPAYDTARGVTADALGNVFVSGSTDGNLSGANAGGRDSFLSKYDAAGNLIWTRQFGTTSDEISGDVSADAHGNVYVTGRTGGSLDGPNLGEGDAFVSKYDSLGNLLWIRQFGTSSNESGWGISSDGLGNVYSYGGTNGALGGPNSGLTDIYLTKFSDPIPEPTSAALGLFAITCLATCHRTLTRRPANARPRRNC